MNVCIGPNLSLKYSVGPTQALAGVTSGGRLARLKPVDEGAEHVAPAGDIAGQMVHGDAAAEVDHIIDAELPPRLKALVEKAA